MSTKESTKYALSALYELLETHYYFETILNGEQKKALLELHQLIGQRIDERCRFVEKDSVDTAQERFLYYCWVLFYVVSVYKSVDKCSDEDYDHYFATNEDLPPIFGADLDEKRKKHNRYIDIIERHAESFSVKQCSEFNWAIRPDEIAGEISESTSIRWDLLEDPKVEVKLYELLLLLDKDLSPINTYMTFVDKDILQCERYKREKCYLENKDRVMVKVANSYIFKSHFAWLQFYLRYILQRNVIAGHLRPYVSPAPKGAAPNPRDKSQYIMASQILKHHLLHQPIIKIIRAKDLSTQSDSLQQRLRNALSLYPAVPIGVFCTKIKPHSQPQMDGQGKLLSHMGALRLMQISKQAEHKCLPVFYNDQPKCDKAHFEPEGRKKKHPWSKTFVVEEEFYKCGFITGGRSIWNMSKLVQYKDPASFINPVTKVNHLLVPRVGIATHWLKPKKLPLLPYVGWGF